VKIYLRICRKFFTRVLLPHTFDLAATSRAINVKAIHRFDSEVKYKSLFDQCEYPSDVALKKLHTTPISAAAETTNLSENEIFSLLFSKSLHQLS
jgi:hypothetical protein